MTIGLIFECGPQGADKQVCEYLAKAIRPGVALTSKTLDNKENLMRDAGRVAAQMLKDGATVFWLFGIYVQRGQTKKQSLAAQQKDSKS